MVPVQGNRSHLQSRAKIQKPKTIEGKVGIIDWEWEVKQASVDVFAQVAASV